MGTLLFGLNEETMTGSWVLLGKWLAFQEINLPKLNKPIIDISINITAIIAFSFIRMPLREKNFNEGILNDDAGFSPKSDT